MSGAAAGRTAARAVVVADALARAARDPEHREAIYGAWKAAEKAAYKAECDADEAAWQADRTAAALVKDRAEQRRTRVAARAAVRAVAVARRAANAASAAYGARIRRERLAAAGSPLAAVAASEVAK